MTDATQTPTEQPAGEPTEDPVEQPAGTEATPGSDLQERLRAAGRACEDTVVWHRRVSPAEAFRALAQAAEDLDVQEWDTYGQQGPVAAIEAEVAEVLGQPEAVFFISGTMAQQAALRIWCERRGSRRVAIPTLAHQLNHEADGPRVLHDFRFEPLTDEPRPAVAADLTGIAGAAQLGAVQLELPLREPGCLLPTWEELTQFSEAARGLGVPLHVDGARLWESRAWFDRPLPEITALFDSVYVSFYKGLGGLSGAAVAGSADLAAELRVWRQRMGGQVFRMTPYAVSALAGLREELPRMGETLAWAQALAAALVERGLRVTPDPPQTSTFQVFADAPAGGADVVTERLVTFMERERIQPSPSWWAASRVPGVVMTEVAIHSAALDKDPETVAGWYADLVAP